jgi:hypothetical protein
VTIEPDGYVLGRSASEYDRLREQARMWEPETARLLDRAWKHKTKEAAT